jgi:hypothetical protein
MPTKEKAAVVSYGKALTGMPRDILCGRSFHILNHHGNLQLHMLVNKYRPIYLKSCPKAKMGIVNSIIEQVKESGARFLRREVDADGRPSWFESDQKTSYKIVSHALRLQKKQLKTRLSHEKQDPCSFRSFRTFSGDKTEALYSAASTQNSLSYLSAGEGLTNTSPDACLLPFHH